MKAIRAIRPRHFLQGAPVTDIAWPKVEFDQIGPRIGERFPDVVLSDQHRRTVDLQRARGKRRAMVLFYRSASW